MTETVDVDAIWQGVLHPTCVHNQLREARKMLAGGWSEPHSTDSRGEWCSPYSEGVLKFCVSDALALAAVSIADHQVMEMFLAKVSGFGPLGLAALEEWYGAPERKLNEVLALFDRAILASRPRVAA